LDDFEKGITPPLTLVMNVGRKMIDEDVFFELVKNAEKNGMSKLKIL